MSFIYFFLLFSTTVFASTHHAACQAELKDKSSLRAVCDAQCQSQERLWTKEYSQHEGCVCRFPGRDFEQSWRQIITQVCTSSCQGLCDRLQSLNAGVSKKIKENGADSAKDQTLWDGTYHAEFGCRCCCFQNKKQPIFVLPQKMLDFLASTSEPLDAFPVMGPLEGPYRPLPKNKPVLLGE